MTIETPKSIDSHSNIYNHIQPLLPPGVDIDDLNDEELNKIYIDHPNDWANFMLSINEDIKKGGRNDIVAITLYTPFIHIVSDTLDSKDSLLTPGISSIIGLMQEEENPIHEVTGERLSKVERTWNALIVRLKEYSSSTKIRKEVQGIIQGIMAKTPTDL